MNLSSIITLANKRVELRFLAMVRSLRAVGCQLPVKVIPYDDSRFELPEGCSWLENGELFTFLSRHRTHPTMRKYLCLLESNYQFVDADICFLRNPERVLSNESGFITCCGHWRNVAHAVNDLVAEYLRTKSTNWQRRTFNSGQFACDRSLYTVESLLTKLSDPWVGDSCLRWRFNEQPGLNLLVNLTNVPIVNLTLPPMELESSWAGDYLENYESFWTDEKRKPYILHWAGLDMRQTRPIDKIFFGFLKGEELHRWQNEMPIRRESFLGKVCKVFASR